MNKKWTDLTYEERKAYTFDQLSHKPRKQAKSVELGEHEYHQLKIEAAKPPHIAKLVCADCHKHITFLSKEQMKYLTA